MDGFKPLVLCCLEFFPPVGEFVECLYHFFTASPYGALPQKRAAE